MTTGDLLKQARVDKRVKIVREQIKEPEPQIRMVEHSEPSGVVQSEPGGGQNEPEFARSEPAVISESLSRANFQANSSASFPRLDDRYEVLSVIGKGGMGAVYKVFDREIERTLAIKVLQQDLADDQTALRRFEQEAEAAAQLEHHNLVSVFAYGKTKDGAPYLVMDYFEGESLSTVLKKESTLDSERALNLFQQICEALAHAHEKGVVHRDVKPANVIVSRSQSGIETARIVDFGIAKILPVSNRETHNLTETRQVFGSPHYMSPEHCLGFKMDERSDIYSLGCLMYEVLTGDPPFNVSDAIQAVIKHINEEARAFPGEMHDDPVKRKLEGVVLKCLEKNQDDRYQTVEEVLADLQLIKDGKTPSRFVRRRAAKLEYSASQFFRAIVGTILLIIFIGYQLMWFGAFDSSNSIFAILMLFVCCGGAALFGSAAHEQYNHMIAGRTARSDWWNAFIIASMALMCLSFMPNAIAMTIEAFHPRAYINCINWLPELVSAFSLAHLFAIGSVFVSLIGRILFNGSKKARWYSSAVQYAGLFCLSVMTATTAFPVQSSEFAELLSDTEVIQKRFPDTSRKLIALSHSLDPLNQSAFFKLVDLQSQVSDAERLYVEYFMLEKRSHPLAVAHFQKSKLYNEQSWQALQEVSKAIKFQPSAAYYVERARLYTSRGDYGYALKDYEEAQRSNPENPDSYLGKARIFAATGNFHLALYELNQIAGQKGGWENPNVFFLRGLLFEKLGSPNLAKRDFAAVTELAKTKTKFTESEACMIAYSFKQIGDDENRGRFLDIAESGGRTWVQLSADFKKIGLPLAWNE